MTAAALDQAIACHRQGRLAEAERLYREVLAAAPAHRDALHMLGLAHYQTGRHRTAVELIEAAIGVDPNQPAAFSNLALAFQALGQYDDALANCDRALALQPDYAEALNNRGNALQMLQRHDDALGSYDRALALRPDYVDALMNRGKLLGSRQQHARALAAYERAAALEPARAEAHCQRGNALLELRRPEDAVASYDRALALRPNYADAWLNRGVALRHLGRHDAALASYDRVLTLRPDNAQALYNRGNALRDLERYEEASRSFARLQEIAPDTPFARGQLLHTKMLGCDWTELLPIAESIKRGIDGGKRVAEPFGYLGFSSSERDLQICAAVYTAAHFPRAPAARWKGDRYDNPKIRVGYLSGEFRHQPTSILMTGLLEHHDRSRFELFAFDNGWDDGSGIRRRIERAVDEMVDIAHLGDSEAADAIHTRKIDILVNLNGYFGRGRQGVFSQRPSPVQVNYLGFPCTLGADYIDYIVADRHVIPPGSDAFYTEKVVRLPDTYQVNDAGRRIALRTPRRAEAGLPEAGFVFCCFNNNFKITPAVFAIWMRLLQQVEGSVLWLLEDNATAARNLRLEAERRGVASHRLVFASRLGLDEHLARHRLADLFLDTLPCNAHTTASDALWAGLPLVTCMGSTFAGRVAGSLLKAVGMPELITQRLEDYEALALRLATTPALLSALRTKLATNRVSCPLFDTDRFRRHLESAYTTMWERYQRGDPPASFAVDPVAESGSAVIDAAV